MELATFITRDADKLFVHQARVSQIKSRLKTNDNHKEKSTQKEVNRNDGTWFADTPANYLQPVQQI